MKRSFEDLAAAFGECRLETPAGRLFKPAVPIDLARALGRRVTTGLMRDRFQPIVDLAVGAPHLASAVTLGVLPVGDRAGLLCVRPADAPPLAVAAIVGEGAATLVSLFFVDLLGSNGEMYGLSPLDRPPEFIANRRPDLLRRAFVTQALTGWMRWTERRGLGPWSILRQLVAERWGRDEWGEVSGAEEQRSLLRIYLAIAYVERPARMARSVAALPERDWSGEVVT